MKQNQNKWVVSATSAALVASAIVPVVSAASFSDIENNDHKDAILALAEAGIVSGYTDGTFKPNAAVTRGNVTKLLGKWLESEGYEIPEDFNKEVRFTDLPVTSADQELVKYAALVKDTKVFNGSNGQLMYSKEMTREQMALVLVRAIKTVYGVDLIADYKEANFVSKITDISNATADENREAIKALEFAKLTTVTAFNPKNSLTRGQFASFLNRAIVNFAKDEVKLTVKTVTVKDATTLEVTLSDDKKHTVKLETALPENKETEVEFEIDGNKYSAKVTYKVVKVASVTVTNATTINAKLETAELGKTVEDFTVLVDGTEVKPTAVVADATGANYTLTIPTLDDKKGKLTVNGTEATYDFATLKVVSLTAINHQTVQVIFNKELDSVDKADFTINNGIVVRNATVDTNNKKIVYLDTTSQTQGYEYSVSYKGDTVGKITLTGNTGSYKTNIQVTQNTELKQISTNHQKQDENVNRGQRTYTVNVKDLKGTVTIALADASKVTVGEDGVPKFEEGRASLRAELGTVNSVIEQVNGVGQFKSVVKDVQIPSNGVITFTVDNESNSEAVIPVVFQDTNSDSRLSIDKDGVPTEVAGVGGETGYYLDEARFGEGFALNVKHAYPALGAFIDGDGNLFNYDAADEFKVNGVSIAHADFNTLLTHDDEIKVNYNPNGKSTFNILGEYGSEAPTNVNAVAENGNVKLEWTGGNIDNKGTVWTVQRASLVGADGIVDTADDIVADFKWESIATTTDRKYTDSNIADGKYIYRIIVVNPVTKVTSESNNSEVVYTPQKVAVNAPTIIQSTVVDKGTPGEVDAGDTWFILFDKTMKLEDGAVVRAKEGNTGLEYSNIVLGKGNTYKTVTRDNQTLLTINFNATPEIAGFETGSDKSGRNNVLQYENLMITKSVGFDSTEGKSLNLTIGDRDLELDNNLPKATRVGTPNFDAKEFTLEFDEAIDPEVAKLLTKYTVRNGNVVNPITNVEVIGWNTVKIYTLNALGEEAKVTQTVNDLAGNTANQLPILVTGKKITGVTPIIPLGGSAKYELNDSNEFSYVTLTFTEPVTFDSEAVADLFIFKHEGKQNVTTPDGETSTRVETVKDDNKSIRVYFNNLVEGNYGKIVYTGINEIKVQDKQLFLKSEYEFNVEDQYAPKIKDAQLEDDLITVTFTEYVEGNANLTNFKLEQDGVSIALSSVTLANGQLKLRVADVEDFDPSQASTLTFVGKNGAIADESNHNLNKFELLVKPNPVKNSESEAE